LHTVKLLEINMANQGNDFNKIIGAAFIGIVGGLLIASILNAFFSPRCPICKQIIPKGANPCPKCQTALKWE
jgi:hypothetical protein